MHYSFVADDGAAIHAAMLAAHGFARIGAKPTLIAVEASSGECRHLARVAGSIDVRIVAKSTGAAQVLEIVRSLDGNVVSAFPGYWLRRPEFVAAMDATVVCGPLRGPLPPAPATGSVWQLPGAPGLRMAGWPDRKLPVGLVDIRAVGALMASGQTGAAVTARSLVLAATLALAAGAGEARFLCPADLESALSADVDADGPTRERLSTIAQALKALSATEIASHRRPGDRPTETRRRQTPRRISGPVLAMARFTPPRMRARA